MEYPSRAILAFVIIAGIPVALMILFHLRDILKKGELVREAPHAPLTRARQPVVYWGIVGIGAGGVAAVAWTIIVATYALLTP